MSAEGGYGSRSSATLTGRSLGCRSSATVGARRDGCVQLTQVRGRWRSRVFSRDAGFGGSGECAFGYERSMCG